MQKGWIVIAILLGWMCQVSAQTNYPNRPVKIEVGYPAGSSADLLARIYTEKLSEQLNQAFVVDNRPGASGTLAALNVARAPGDGYTLLLTVLADAIEASAFKDLNYRFLEDFTPIAALAGAPIILVVSPDLGVNSVAELIALAKQKPGELLYGSAGIASTPHLAGELFNYMTGSKLVHVPYKGIPAALTDLLGGRIQAVFATAPTVAGFVKDGRLKALANTSAKRSKMLPDVPTMAESGLNNYDVIIWYGLLAPNGTPAAVRARLADIVSRANTQSAVQKQLEDSGAEALSLTLDDFGAFMKRETQKWKTIVNYANISMQ